MNYVYMEVILTNTSVKWLFIKCERGVKDARLGRKEGRSSQDPATNQGHL